MLNECGKATVVFPHLKETERTGDELQVNCIRNLKSWLNSMGVLFNWVLLIQKYAFSLSLLSALLGFEQVC
jgi:hypothetical protein